METEKIITNEEIIETAEKITEASSGKVLGVAAGIGLATLAGVIVYKYVAKPAIAKFKAKRDGSDIIEGEGEVIL